MATHTTLASLFADIADAIRATTGSTEAIVADNFPTEIANMQKGVQVKSIATSGTYDSATYHGNCWAAIDADGNLLLGVEGGTSSSYENIFFSAASLPSGVELANRSPYLETGVTTGRLYAAIFTGVTYSVEIALEFSSRNSSNDYVTCSVTITEVA